MNCKKNLPLQKRYHSRSIQ